MIRTQRATIVRYTLPCDCGEPVQYRLAHLLLLTFFWAVLLAIGTCIGFDVWAGLLLLSLAAAAVPLAVRLVRKRMCAFWDFLDEHRHNEGRQP